MTASRLALAGLSVALLAAPATASAQTKALEVDAFGGVSRALRVESSDEHRIWSRNGGESFALGAVYRSPYFLSPFVDFAYYPYFASQETRDVGPPFGSLRSTNSLSVVAITAGAAYDVWRLRFRAGIGTHQLRVSSTVLGERIEPREIDMGYAFGVAGWLLMRHRVRIGAEARVVLVVESDMPILALGATIGGDAISW
jgi:hypothetical protein